MATQNILDIVHSHNGSQVRREFDEAMRIARERLNNSANAVPVTEIHYTTDPGPDFTPRAWGWMS